MKKVFLYAYDRQNLGDDLFVHTIAKRYPDVQFYMWSRRENRRTYASLPNLKVIDRDSRFVRFLHQLRPSLVARYRTMFEKRCDAMVYIGGSIFFEYEHGEGIPMWWEYMAQNHALYVMGANFGPYLTEGFREKMASIFAKMKDICFRDHYSVSLFENVPTVRYAPDILFSHPMPKVQPRSKQLFVSVIDCADKSEGDTGLSCYEERYVVNMAQLLEQYLTRGWKIILSSFCESEGDSRAVERICQQMKLRENDDRVTVLAYDGTNADTLTEAIAASEYVIASRFHGVILALAAGRPVFPVIYSDKTARVLEDFGFTGNWADVRRPESICYDDSICNLALSHDIQNQAAAAQEHFARLDEKLGRAMEMPHYGS